MEKILNTVQNCIHYRFQQVKHLQRALTHSSYANEQGASCEYALEHNERLEFLGDAVLELCITDELYTRFPHAREGDLTRMRAKLVSKPALAEVAREIELDKHMLLGKGEESQGGRERGSLLGDAMEALIGAVFQDSDFSTTQKWLLDLLKDRIPQSLENEHNKDFKSLLQEATQKRYKERPSYALEECTGPDHDKTFVIRLTLPGDETILAHGSSMKKAEQKAAQQGLDLLGSMDQSCRR